MANQNSLESGSLVSAARSEERSLESGRWAGGMRLETLGNLSHELRTPLQVMLGYLDILREEWAERFHDEPRQILDRMNASAHQLAQTVENVIEFVLAEAGAHAKVEEEVAIRELIAELTPTFEAANESRGLVLKFELEQAPAQIRSERRALRLILQNLALNAIKFTAVGTVTIAVRRHRGDLFGPDGVEIEVRDTGPGISPEQLELACEPFTQLSRSSVRRHRGVGLGLAVVRRNVAALGGTMDAHSTPGVGSTFVVRIPGRQPDAAERSSAAERVGPGETFANTSHRESWSRNGKWLLRQPIPEQIV